MAVDGKELPLTSIDCNSKIAVKLVIEIVVIVVAIVSTWYNLRLEMNNINNGLDKINGRLNTMELGGWTSTEDYVFMERYSRANKLQMPTHKGE